MPDPEPTTRAVYWSAICRAITEHAVPEGYCLRHSGRDGGDLVIRVAPERERATTPEPLPPISVLLALDAAHRAAGPGWSWGMSKPAPGIQDASAGRHD